MIINPEIQKKKQEANEIERKITAKIQEVSKEDQKVKEDTLSLARDTERLRSLKMQEAELRIDKATKERDVQALEESQKEKDRLERENPKGH